MNKNGLELIRVVITIPKSLYLRGKKYFHRDKNKNYFALDAFEKRVNFLEGRDKKTAMEQRLKDAAYIQELIDSGEVKIK